ncbi:hypothetical protein C5167_038474 [Papaver somniferum]|uniref:Uncharacterized protein n=1 Tax=Papaver somniferum TaxID=3469 RepID=A0A4Y7IBX7_PAPSO|nr:hypothetical protein C5167_038474 [Papaver somniferum]
MSFKQFLMSDRCETYKRGQKSNYSLTTAFQVKKLLTVGKMIIQKIPR